MKCVKVISTNEIKRIKDEQAMAQVEAGKVVYVPKSEWKALRTTAQVSLAVSAAMTVLTPDQESAAVRRADKKKQNQSKKSAHKNGSK